MKRFGNFARHAALCAPLLLMAMGTAARAQDAAPVAAAPSAPAITKNAKLSLPMGVTAASASTLKNARPILQMAAGKGAATVENEELWAWRGASAHANATKIKAEVETKFKAAGYSYQADKPLQSKSGGTAFTLFRAQNATAHTTLVGFWLDDDTSVGFALANLPAASDAAPVAPPATVQPAAEPVDPNDPLAPLTSSVTGVKLPRGAVRSADAKLVAAVTANLQGLAESGGVKGTCQPAESLEWKGATLTDAAQQAKETDLIKALESAGWTYQKVGGDTRPNNVTRTFFIIRNGARQGIGILRHAKQSLMLDWSEIKPAP